LQASTTHTSVFLGDHLWQGGTTYGTVDGPGGPSVAAVLGPGDHLRQQKLAVDGMGGLILGDHPWHNRPLASSKHSEQVFVISHRFTMRVFGMHSKQL